MNSQWGKISNTFFGTPCCLPFFQCCPMSTGVQDPTAPGSLCPSTDHSQPGTWPGPGIHCYIHCHLASGSAIIIRSQSLSKPNSTQLQFNLSWVWHENCFANPSPSTETQCPHNFSCNWVNCSQTLMDGLWAFSVTFVQATFVLVTFVHIRKISAVSELIWTIL